MEETLLRVSKSAVPGIVLLLAQEILVQNGAKGLLPPKSPETVRATRVVHRLLPAAQMYCANAVESAKKDFAKDFGETYDAAVLSSSSASSKKQSAIDRIAALKETHSGMLGSWRVVVLDSPLPNAFVTESFPRRVFVCRGLLEQVSPTDEELAMVVGHEIAHLIHGHVGKRMMSTMFLSSLQLVLLALLDPTGIASIAWELFGYVASE